MPTNWEAIREEYETSKLTMKELAEKHDVKPTTLRSRKNREKWQRNDVESVATQRNHVATKQAIKEVNANKELSDKEKNFCFLYLQYFNQTKAYQEAFGVKYKSAHANAWKLMAREGIKTEIERLKEAQRQDLYLESLDIKRQWMKQAFADITDFVEFGKEEVVVDKDEEGKDITRTFNYVYVKDSDEVDGSLIQEVKNGRDGVSVKLYDKQKALQELQKFLEDSGSGVGDSIVIVDEWTDEDEN